MCVCVCVCVYLCGMLLTGVSTYFGKELVFLHPVNLDSYLRIKVVIYSHLLANQCIVW